MGFYHRIWFFLLVVGLANASALPGTKHHHAARDSAVNVDTEVEVVLSSLTTLEELADELAVDLTCLIAANPLLSLLGPGEKCIVPQACCGTSCKGDFCSSRPWCQGQTSSTAPVQTGSSTTCYSTITTSVPSTVTSSPGSSTISGAPTSFNLSTTLSVSTSGASHEFSSSIISNSSGTSTSTPSLSLSSPASISPSQSSNTTLTSATTSVNSQGQTIISESGVELTLPLGLSTATTITTGGQEITFTPSAISSSASSNSIGTLTGANSGTTNSSSFTSRSASPSSSTSVGTVTGSSGGAITNSSTSATPSASSSTVVPGLVTTTNSLGQTIISDGSGGVTLPTGISTASIVTLPDSSVVTFQPSSAPSQPSNSSSAIPGLVATTNSLGQTIISDSSVATTLPTGITTASVITLPDGSAFTFQPTTPSQASNSSIIPGGFTTTNSVGETVVSSSGESFTIPPSLSTATTITNGDGSVITFSPTITPTSNALNLTTTNSQGLTIISESGESFTVSSGISTLTTITNGDGSTITFSPTSPSSTSSVAVLTTTNSDGSTIISESGQSFTIPTGLTQVTTITESDGNVLTFSPSPLTSSTSSLPTGFIFPITTSVSAPKATNGGTVIPCNLWFFNICIRWQDTDILGWEFDLPPGTYPPGPPPAITFPPELHISVSVSGTLPDWPSFTIGPDHLPTYSSEPTECETESAELCLTSTSFGASDTTTTATQVASTCATVYGCSVEGSSTSTTTTSSCASGTACSTCFSWSYDADVDWDSVGNDDPDGSAIPAAQRVRRTVMPTPTTLIQAAARITSSPTPTAPPFDHVALQRRTVTDTRSSTAFGTCNLRTSMTFGNYPDVSDYPSFPSASSYFVLSQRSTVAGTCYAGYIYSTDNLAAASAAVGSPTYATTFAPRPTPVVNTDHVYELSLLGAFFTYALGIPDAPTCDEFNTLFVDTGLLQQIYDNLPNINHPDFAAVDRFINQAKAGYFTANGGTANIAAAQYQRAADELQKIGIVAGLVNLPEIVTLFRTTHQRLYQAFGVWDQGFAGCGQPGASDTWAATYSQWMTSFLSSRADVYTNAASAWYQTLDNGAAAGARNVPVYTQLQASYPASSFSIPVDAMASGLVAAAPAAGGRKRQAACTLSSSPSSSASTSSPVSPTPTGSSSPLTNSSPPSTSSTPITSSTSSPPLPTLTTGITTPSGSSCVATATATDCALGPGGQTACVATPVCSSWVETTTTTSSTTSSSASATPTGQVYIDIYTDSDCINVLEQTQLNEIGQCYSPTDSDGNPVTFKCFSLTYISDAAENSAALTAFKGTGCFSQDTDTEQKTYPDLLDIQYDDEQPFNTMGSLSLGDK